jgi:carbon-monoxide dehydrogenase catalytic subunit
MGPCRIVGKDKESKRGVCGATLETIAARNFTRQVAAGGAAHSDHGRDAALSMKAIAEGEMQGVTIRDEVKLAALARDLGIEATGKDIKTLAGEVAEAALSEFGRQYGETALAARAPAKRRELWRKHGVMPRGIDREVVEALHHTAPGNDQNVENLLDASMRSALGSGWGGSMLATDLQDCIFGTPAAVRSSSNLGVLKEDEVNIVIHGHEPLLSSVIVEVAQSPEMLALAEKVGAKGINLAGICCTANETLMRQGVPPAGNMLHQELAILTGAVEAMTVDIQCIFQGLSEAASHFHTLLFSTSPKAKIGEGGLHIDVDEHDPIESAVDIVRQAVENFPNRGKVHIPEATTPLVAGFSHEYIRYMLGGKMRASFRPLNDNIINGRIRGVAAVVGCSNARVTQDQCVVNVVRELIANNVLVVATGCSAITSGKHGYMAPETMEFAGPGLKEVCDAVGIPPVLHLGSCVDNSRILTILAEVVEEGGLGDDISDLPAVGISPEWFSEKALEIATYVIGSGTNVIFGGVGSPTSGSEYVTKYMEDGWTDKFGAGFYFIEQPQDIVTKTLDIIDAKRAALKIDVPQERVLFDMEMRRELSV